MILSIMLLQRKEMSNIRLKTSSKGARKEQVCKKDERFITARALSASFFLPFSRRSTLSFEPAKLPTQPRTSPEKRGSGKTLAEPGSSEQTKDADVAQEEPEGGGSKVKAKAAVSRR